MLKNYLLVVLRNLMRNKTVSLIHITGFGLGMAAFLFAAQTVIFEYSFDNFHQNGDRIFVMASSGTSSKGEQGRITQIDPAIAHRIDGAIPEIQFVARYAAQNLQEPYCAITYINLQGEQKTFNEVNAKYADSNFLKIFEFPVYKGSTQNSLSDNTSLVMTRATAEKYFGDDDPIGKVLELTTGGSESRKSKFSYQVAIVLENIPANSSLQFDILLPFRNFEENYKQDLSSQWGWMFSFHNFILMKNAAIDLPAIERKINKLVPDEFHRHWATFGWKSQYELLPISKFHFDPDENKHLGNRTRVTNRSYVNIIGLIGLAILVIAIVNYINLTTAKALKRAKEVGIRKVVGAGRTQLIKQFMVDAVFVALLGFLFALTLLQILKPLLSVWINLHVAQVNWWSVDAWIIILVLSVCVLLAGFVPSIILTKVQPIVALKGKVTQTTTGNAMRKGLVIFQFSISVFLIIFSAVIVTQLAHMQSKDKGFEIEHRIAIQTAGTEDFDLRKFRTFKERVLKNLKVINVTATTGLPGAVRYGGVSVDNPAHPEEQIGMQANFVDYDYIATIGAEMKAGREFSEEFTSSDKPVMLNEMAVKLLGYASPEEAIGKTLNWHWTEGDMLLNVVGVVSDFHLESPSRPIRPLLYFFCK